MDDVSGGYASLEAIVATKPEVVKIDRHIVHELGKDSLKRSIVKFIVAFCKENSILSVAEGIERKEDLDILIELGVDAGQGITSPSQAPWPTCARVSRQFLSPMNFPMMICKFPEGRYNTTNLFSVTMTIKVQMYLSPKSFWISGTKHLHIHLPFLAGTLLI